MTLGVYVVQYASDGTEMHAEPIRRHSLRSEAERTRVSHERSMAFTPGTRAKDGSYRLVEIREEP